MNFQSRINHYRSIYWVGSSDSSPGKTELYLMLEWFISRLLEADIPLPYARFRLGGPSMLSRMFKTVSTEWAARHSYIFLPPAIALTCLLEPAIYGCCSESVVAIISQLLNHHGSDMRGHGPSNEGYSQWEGGRSSLLPEWRMRQSACEFQGMILVWISKQSVNAALLFFDCLTATSLRNATSVKQDSQAFLPIKEKSEK